MASLNADGRSGSGHQKTNSSGGGGKHGRHSSVNNPNLAGNGASTSGAKGLGSPRFGIITQASPQRKNSEAFGSEVILNFDKLFSEKIKVFKQPVVLETGFIIQTMIWAIIKVTRAYKGRERDCAFAAAT